MIELRTLAYCPFKANERGGPSLCEIGCAACKTISGKKYCLLIPSVEESIRREEE